MASGLILAVAAVSLPPTVKEISSHETLQPNHRSVADSLNERFMSGHPSNATAEAGVILHQFDVDMFDRSSRRLRESSVSKWPAWMPCPAGEWCAKFGDRFSVSLLNARKPFAFNEYNGGLVVSADTAARSIMCSWATDARSFRAARTCLSADTPFKWGDSQQGFVHREGCVPGCINGVSGQVEDADTVARGQPSPTWCDPDGPDSWCPWRPEHLANMLAQQERGFLNTDCSQNNGCRYNELVLNSSIWVSELPRTFEAWFYLKATKPDGSAMHQVLTAHHDFLKKYGMRETDVPMLEVDLRHPVAPPGPFREVRNHMLRGTKYAAS